MVGTLTGAAPKASFSTQPTISGGQQDLLSLLTGNPAGQTNAFASSILEPTKTQLLDTTLPAVQGQFGRSAGGAFGSGGEAARSQASRSAATAADSSIIDLLKTLFGGAEGGTQTTTGVGTGGSTGLLQGGLSSPALSAAVTGLFGLL